MNWMSSRCTYSFQANGVRIRENKLATHASDKQSRKRYHLDSSTWICNAELWYATFLTSLEKSHIQFSITDPVSRYCIRDYLTADARSSFMFPAQGCDRPLRKPRQSLELKHVGQVFWGHLARHLWWKACPHLRVVGINGLLRDRAPISRISVEQSTHVLRSPPRGEAFPFQIKPTPALTLHSIACTYCVSGGINSPIGLNRLANVVISLPWYKIPYRFVPLTRSNAPGIFSPKR